MEIYKLLDDKREVTSSNGMQWVGFISKFVYTDEDDDGNETTSDPTTAIIVNFGSTLYMYIGVTREMYNELVDAESVGSYFYKNIRDKFDTYKSSNNGEDWKLV